MSLPSYSVYLGEPGESIHAIIERYWPAARPALLAKCAAESRGKVDPEPKPGPDTDEFDTGEPVGSREYRRNLGLEWPPPVTGEK